MALFRTKQSRQNLNDWLGQDPGRGQDNYSARIGSALANTGQNRQTPAQRYNTGSDPNVQASRENYRLMAQRAAETAAAGAEVLSGGYDASYAQSAAEQGRQVLMENQHDNEQNLRQLALEGMAAENSQADILAQALLGAQQLEMSANQMAQDRYQAQRDFLTGEVQQAQTEQDNFWGNVWDALVWAADTALKTYDNYKGYTQQQIENWMDYQQFLAQEDQRRIDNERYDTEWTASREDAAWKQKMDELAFTAGRTDADREYDLAVQQLALDDALTQAQIANYGRRSSGGSGGGSGLDLDDLDAVVQRYANANLIGDEYQKSVYGSILTGMGYDPSSFGGTSTGAARTAGTSSTAPLLMSSRYMEDMLLDAAASSMMQQGYSDDEILRRLGGY